MARAMPRTAVMGVAWVQRAFVAAGALALVFGLLALVVMLARPLALLFAAVVIAEALSPIVGRLERRLPRVLAVVLVYLAVLAVIGAVIWAVVPPLIGQAISLLARTPDLLQGTLQWLERFEAQLEHLPSVGREPVTRRVGEALTSLADRATNLVVSLPLLLVSLALDLLLVFILSIYWLVAAPALHGFTLSLFPEERRERAGQVLREMGQMLGGFVRGVVIDAAIVGVIVYAGLRLIGMDFPLVLALVAALGELIPIVGPWLAGIPAVGIALLHSPVQAAIVAGFYLAVQQIEGYLIVPNVMREQADIPPLLGLFALFVGVSLGGVLGALIALPLAGALRVLVLRVVAPAVRRWSGAAEAEGVARPEPAATAAPRPLGARAPLGRVVAASLAAGALAGALWRARLRR